MKCIQFFFPSPRNSEDKVICAMKKGAGQWASLFTKGHRRGFQCSTPKECESDTSFVWKLNKSVYGFVDASRNKELEFKF
jgi:hypothetical protein